MAEHANQNTIIVNTACKIKQVFSYWKYRKKNVMSKLYRSPPLYM